MNVDVDQLRQLSEQALHEASHHDWQKALQLQQQRNTLMRTVFSPQGEKQPLPDAELESVISFMLKSDKQLKQMIDIQRPSLEQAFQQFRKKRQNIDEYLSHRPM